VTRRLSVDEVQATVTIIRAPVGARRVALAEFSFPPYVKAGEAIVSGQVLCEVSGSYYSSKKAIATRKGVVNEIHVQDRAEIQEGDPLFTIEFAQEPSSDVVFAPTVSWETASRIRDRKKARLADDVTGSETEIEAPVEGIFYRAESPTARPLVGVGETIERGQTVCIVEAMKVFNEILYCGRKNVTVASIEVANETLVKPGQILITLEPVEK
jgi:acetyl-CoA carboxylase biotin carboxyl carrier protein